MSNPPPSWHIYGKEMMKLGLGVPLWDPEPDKGKPITYGSVLWEGEATMGRYMQLFNAALDDEDGNDVPTDHEKLDVSMIFGPRPTIHNHLLYSKSIHDQEHKAVVGAGSGAVFPAEAGAGYKFVCKSDTGAVLLLQPPAITTHVQSKRRMVTYMRKHFDRWLELANAKHDMDLKETDLFFVSGTTATTKWAVAAFQNSSYREKEGHVFCNIDAFVRSEIAIRFIDESLRNPDFNFGPQNSDSSGMTVLRPGGDPVPDQVVFMHYYKMRRRLFWMRRIEAAAGFHEIVEGEDDDDEMRPSSPRQSINYDPVEPLLDYILENSVADVAIACDRDLIVIFQSTGIPDDIAAALLQAKPPIDVDENGLGTFSVDIRFPEDQATSPETVPTVAEPPRVDTLPALQTNFNEPPARDDSGDPFPSERPEDKLPAFDRDPVATGHNGTITALATSPDNLWIASGSDDASIILWSVADRMAVLSWEAHADTIAELAFSPDGRTLASAGADGQVVLWDVATGAQRGALASGAEHVHAVAWSPDGKRLATAADDGTVRLWDAASLAQTAELPLHGAMVAFVFFSPDGRWLASGGADNGCHLWEVTASGAQLRHRLSGHEGMVWTAAFDPASTRIATASDDGTVVVWSVAPGQELVRMHGHQGPVWSVAFSADGAQLLSASSDGTARVCNSFSGVCVRSLEGHASMVNAAAFAPDGLHVASASSDNTVKLWRLDNGQNVRTLNEHNDKVTSVVFTPDGQVLASGSDDGTVHVRLFRDYL
ncbi:WD40 repeat-like protein [Epithele typhae]|uniref:WD40 repeat-like protein n=1 Tax=Epithele typhae TaxID=378194 RepID=UPI002008A6CF|nr:WD40 repeat-like protein [Epithele typhae]KAH9934535.1 WD40 repeat-like protein [Epithele typhae]